MFGGGIVTRLWAALLGEQTEVFAINRIAHTGCGTHDLLSNYAGVKAAVALN
jgi:hypothetical protein